MKNHVESRPCSCLTPKHGAWIWFSLGTNVNTPIFEYSHQNLGTMPMSEYKGLLLYWNTKWHLGVWSTQFLNTRLFCAGAQATVLMHLVWTQLNDFTWKFVILTQIGIGSIWVAVLKYSFFVWCYTTLLCQEEKICKVDLEQVITEGSKNCLLCCT